MTRPHHREIPLPANERVRIVEQRVLADDWFVLKKNIFDYRHSNGRWQRLQRETYDRGDGAALLLFNRARGTVVLTRQFRFPAYANGLADGMLVEACAGLLDNEAPEVAIRREVQEETGFDVRMPRACGAMAARPDMVGNPCPWVLQISVWITGGNLTT